MPSRYEKRTISLNNTSFYSDLMFKRGTVQIRQFLTGEITYPTVEQIRTLTIKNHHWKTGDHYSKLAHKFYGDATYWWVIAIFNKKPTEASIEYGDRIYIPLPLYKVVEFFNIK
tara:strand:+ start:3564 stop:3905 length:342 start_codon:yes stop_codon:yes gene_type:complete